MEKSKNSELQGAKNAAVERNSEGFSNKIKFPLWLYPETMEEVNCTFTDDNCSLHIQSQANLNYPEAPLNALSPILKKRSTFGMNADTDNRTATLQICILLSDRLNFFVNKFTHKGEILPCR